MTERLIIKKSVKEDIKYIEQIYEESIAWLNQKGIHQWKTGVYPTPQTALNAFMEGSLYSCFACDTLAGTFVINEKQLPHYAALGWKYTGGKVLVLHTLAVKPDQTGKGIGKAIVQYVEGYARQNAYDAIRLDAFPDNTAAIVLYKGFGFEYVGKILFEIKEPGYEWFDCYEKCTRAQKEKTGCPKPGF